MFIDGSILVGAGDIRREPGFQAINPATGAALPTFFSEATGDDVVQACALANAASAGFAALTPDQRARFLEAAADAILAFGDVLVETAMAETGLPRLRLEGERGRTMSQLRLFAGELRRGEWLDVTIDPALPDRIPPRPDLRRMQVALGPVAVFGASNFPLAFSVAGGDTASALATGCPVVVKGHPGHPGTGELVARAIRSAVASCGLPEGVFSFLPGRANSLGAALVRDPRITAVGFTGSRQGGLALMDIAARRAQPIPVYAEMSAINPVVLMPAALSARAEALAGGFAGSLMLGAGQFCTNPGLVIAIAGDGLDRFKTAAVAALAGSTPQGMLTPGIHAAYEAGVDALAAHAEVTRVGGAASATLPNRCAAALFETSAAAFIADGALGHEIFGAAALIVRCRDLAELREVVEALEGQLTASLHVADEDQPAAAELLPLLARKVGRVLANGWPTGVEVTWAMVHGGPFPATSDGRSTSVGTLAMARFLRPVCYQDIPDALLPPPLRHANPWRLPRTMNGQRERAA